jgi:hypothetical protein
LNSSGGGGVPSNLPTGAIEVLVNDLKRAIGKRGLGQMAEFLDYVAAHPGSLHLLPVRERVVALELVYVMVAGESLLMLSIALGAFDRQIESRI